MVGDSRVMLSRALAISPPVSDAAGGGAANAGANSRLAKLSKEKNSIAFQRWMLWISGQLVSVSLMRCIASRLRQAHGA